MNPQHHKTQEGDAGVFGLRRGLLRGALLTGLALAGLGLAAPPALGQISTAGSGDSVGSLPSEYGLDGHEITPHIKHLPMRLVLVGRQAELRALVERAVSLDEHGGGHWTLTPMAAPGMARLTLQGAVELVLDRRALESSFTTVTLELGAPFAGGSVQIAAGGQRRAFTATLQPLDLHLHQLAWSGLADGGVALRAAPPPWLATSLGGAAARLDISATADTIRLVQRTVHPTPP